ncbi:uncharacterized protein DUF4124 [Tamilnaduibacter salinus]|uniref:Uncharacterized protein DUF4124 n=1 Tax=Tamilnaduibacter salinus TaxID=1484056 RepID=A0A2A2HZ52_9GAMM|nr:DUF4124 domain-containing protein [Tamilnaduibacter salinus]PAV24597.1 hypothetical protein CF392_15355 [Tamilnaduibacter salinus]PVY76983.1 uncharacterized protein DUF4124 [Tamilnaduibacter salinus]
MTAKRQAILATALCIGLTPALAVASTMYRYTDENGKTVISNTVPSNASERGYDILNSQGRVIERVEPAPTEEEIEARKARQERKAQQEAQRKQDAELLRTYSHPDDAVRALRRKLEERRSLVQLKRGNISVVRSQLAEQEQRAADMERAGQTVSEAVTERIDRLQSRIKEIRSEIEEQQAETRVIREEYEEKIRRLETITGKERTLSIELPDADGPT